MALVSKPSVLGQHAAWVYPHGLKIVLCLKPQLSPELAFPQGQHGHWHWAEKEDWGGHEGCALHHQNTLRALSSVGPLKSPAFILPSILARAASASVSLRDSPSHCRTK